MPPRRGARRRAHRRGRRGPRRRCGWSSSSASTTAASSRGCAARRRRRADRDRRAGRRPLVPGRPTHAARTSPRSREFELEAGDDGPVRAHLAPVARARAGRPSTGTRRREDTTRLVARVVARSRYDGRTATSCALPDHAQGADLRADRRHRRRADHVAARAARRRAQLGLPLLLAARRDVHALRAAARRLHRGGAAPGATGCCARSPGRPTSCRSCTAWPASGG